MKQDLSTLHTIALPRTFRRLVGLGRLLSYQATLLSLTVALLIGFVITGTQVENWWAVLGLGGVAAAAERSRVRLSANTEGSISLVPTVFAAGVFGPLAAMIVAAASVLGDFPPFLTRERRLEAAERGHPYLKWGVYTCSRAASGAFAGLGSLAAGTMVMNPTAKVALGTVLAAFVAEPLDVGFVLLTMRVRGLRPAEGFRALAPVMLASIPLYTPVAAVVGIAYEELSPWTLPLFFVPALAAQRLYALYQQQRELTDGLISANERLERASLSFAGALVATLDARDRYTAGHSAAVAVYARDIARRLGLSESQQNFAQLAGLVHDIGKIGLPAGLLEKPGALTLDERRQMERHSTIGERILSRVDSYTEIAAVVRHHHERVDGQGYPDGLIGDQIPLLARIIAVADAYSAMTSDRPYRDAMPSRVARLRLAQAVESQFDTSVVAAFEAILATASEEYRLGKQPDFDFDLQDTDSKQELGGEISSIHQLARMSS